MPIRMQPKGYQSSGLLTANSLIKSTPGRLGNLMAMTSVTNTAVTVVLYDTSSASANTDAVILAKVHITASDVYAYESVPLPDVVFKLGCYAVRTDCEYIVHFS